MTYSPEASLVAVLSSTRKIVGFRTNVDPDCTIVRNKAIMEGLGGGPDEARCRCPGNGPRVGKSWLVYGFWLV